MTVEELHTVPATLNGGATHNVLNAAIAVEIANELRLGAPAKEALLRFGADPRDNVGRLMQYDVGGVTAVIDYAHNAQGVTALIDATRSLPARRRAIALGTGGDRDDVALQGIAQAAADSGIIDLFIAKEMPKFLRGRDPGSISGVLLDALRAAGVAESRLASADDDLSAARLALSWARDGDLLLLATHDERDAVLALVAKCVQTGWKASQPLP
ncbi:MAG TPA: cyanophycin synthetase [Gemmatimonadaceae bacterium]|nr:cyanophycin synthetase [Gemmatimonadaceae bacterium]